MTRGSNRPIGKDDCVRLQLRDGKRCDRGNVFNPKFLRTGMERSDCHRNEAANEGKRAHQGLSIAIEEPVAGIGLGGLGRLTTRIDVAWR